jgi:molybdopterin molybdotransferase
VISVTDALHSISSQELYPREEQCSVVEALGATLSKDVYSPIDMPPFRQSAMDGYALKHSNDRTYRLVDESQAGNDASPKLNLSDAVRIFTGALVPDDADTVVMQEHVQANGNEVSVQTMPKPFSNIREKGEQINEGGLALVKGMQINAAAVGFLSALGLEEVSVYQKPKVGILITGNELQSVGTSLKKGCVYESNSSMLKSALRQAGVSEVETVSVLDDLQSTKDAVKNLLNKSDILLVSGGISVGDYDFVKEALIHNKVEELFYKVNQKPGKPLWFGKKASKFVFALPGNPASVLTCFYIYVNPMLQRWMTGKSFSSNRILAKCTSGVANKSGKTLFLKAILNNDGSVSPQGGQSSAMMHTYALSNVLMCVPEGKKQVHQGEEVECIKLPR